MSSNGKDFLFVGSYVPESEAGIHGCVFNAHRGELILQSSFTGIANPSFLRVHPNGRFLYCVSETSLGSDGQYGSVWAFRIQPETMAIEPINQQSTEGDWPCHVAIGGSGRWLMASNYGTGNAALYPILTDGSLGEMQAFIQHEGSGPNAARQEGAHAHSATFTPDNCFVIVADLGIDQLVVYQFDVDTGSLTKHDEVPTRPGAGPRHLAFHPNGRFLFVANELDSTVTVYTYQAEAGKIEALQTVLTLPAADPENTVADIHISVSGERLYVSNRGHNSVAVFAVGGDGRLATLAISSCGGNWPRNFALAGDGRFILVANRRTHDVVVLPLDRGGLVGGTAVHQLTVTQPSCIEFLSFT